MDRIRSRIGRPLGEQHQERQRQQGDDEQDRSQSH
jgi:hypothetical protein